MNDSVATLGTLGDRGELSRLELLDSRYFPQVGRLATMIARGQSRQAALDFGQAEEPSGLYGALLAELRQANLNYSHAASRSREIGSVGRIVAILFMLLAFTVSLYRATRIAREKHQLLERSRVEALTDALTGLPNRRSLFADMDALLREWPPPQIMLARSGARRRATPRPPSGTTRPRRPPEAAGSPAQATQMPFRGVCPSQR